ncbi:hypothetical protein Agau_L101195 [Agrobacterium tumefaciens F2]|jgi:hypothetical protein|nr:hypothetical protein Agau_L101195 [Agrobacterium tumefaciens F2]
MNQNLIANMRGLALGVLGKRDFRVVVITRTDVAGNEK